MIIFFKTKRFLSLAALLCIAVFFSCTTTIEQPPFLSSASNEASSSSFVESSSSLELSSSSSSNFSSSSSSSFSSSPSSSSTAPSSSSSLPSSSSSSEQIQSSSSREPRSSSSKGYEDYPPLEEGASGVKRGVTTRYWDGCRTSCSIARNCRACAKNGYDEVSPGESNAYACFDMAPFAINDTLAYAFAATLETTLPCGKCARLQFNDEWPYDASPLVTHRALKGKTLIVMANNTGTVGENHFDIMIPGGGLGAFDCFSEQIGSNPSDLGYRMGGLLSECMFDEDKSYGVPSNRFTLEMWQDCLTKKCHRAFDGKPKELLDGCLWQSSWLMAADNPNVYWTEVACPKALVEKYNSTQH